MSVRTSAKYPLRLTLPGAAIRWLREAGIYCTPEISLEFQRAGKRYVLRGRESGGSVRQIGRYVTFCDEQGQRLPWFLRPDSVTPNAEHAIVIAPALVSVEMFRVEHTYELLVARHQIHAQKEGARPKVASRVVFRGWQGQLPLDLAEKDRAVAGRITPEFFTRAGEPRRLPAEYVEAVQAATLGANCGPCVHPHFLIAPNAAAAAAITDAVTGGASVASVAQGQMAGAEVE